MRKATLPRKSPKPDRRRRGAIAVLAAVLLVVMIAMIAFAVDIGYLGLARTQLQVAADSAALAAAATAGKSRGEMETVAKSFASANKVAGRNVQLSSSDIIYGTWNTTTRTFAPSATPSNAVKVITRADDANGGKVGLFFGGIFGVKGQTESASAIATMNPRDIAFVIDLSGSMNDDTEPDNTSSINGTYGSGIGSNLINQVYADFGYNATYGSEPSQYIGQGLSGVSKKSSESSTLSQLTSTSGPLSNASIPSQYRIAKKDSSSTCTTKAYSWIMDVQIRALLPAAKPVPTSTNSGNYNYWKTYIDYYWDTMSYRSYVMFMMYYGARTSKPGGSLYTPLSQFSADCPYHTESTAGGSFSFPPREMPTHAGRRAIIAALQVIKEVNQSIVDTGQRDWVSLITFDAASNGAVTQVPLTSDYNTAMQGCTKLQAVADAIGSSTATEVGLIAAANHIKPQSQGGVGREHTNKIVVLMTDGMPNQYTSSGTAISNYISQHSSSNFYGGSGSYAKDAALMQTSMVQGNNWYLYPVGLGAGCDYTFMDRMARMGATANDSGQAARGTGNPDDVESVLTDIFEKIITNPKLRLVK